MDLQERVRGRRNKSTLLLRESILDAWEMTGEWARKEKRDMNNKNGEFGKGKERGEKGDMEREHKRGIKINEGRERKLKDNLSYQTGVKFSHRETQQVTATRRETALFKCWHCEVCEVSVCSSSCTRHSWAHSSALKEFL